MIKVRRKNAVKNIVDVILFAVNMLGIMVSCELFYFFYRFKTSGRTELISENLGQNMEASGIRSTYRVSVILFIICSAFVIIVFMYFLNKLFKGMCEKRGIDIGIKYLLGYRKKRVLVNELFYGLAKIFTAALLASLVSATVFKIIGDIEVIGAMMRTADMRLELTAAGFIGAGIAAALAVIDVCVNVQREYIYKKFI